MKNAIVLVTGCAGFIPSFVAQRLVEMGAYVIGVDNLFTGSSKNMQEFADNSRFTYIKADVTDQKIMGPLVQKADYVYHGAIRGIGISATEAIAELDVNTKSVVLLLELMKKYPVKRFVYPSSASVYGNTHKIPEHEDDLTQPASPYGVSKLAAERYCMVYNRMFHIPVVALRYFNTYGPRQRHDSLYGGVISIFMHNAHSNKPLKIYGDGTQTRDFTYIDDTVSATLAAFTAPTIDGEVINIASGHEYTVNQLATDIRQIAGKKSLSITHIQSRSVDNIDRRLGDISKARRLLGYNPQTTLAEGLRKTYDWYRRRNDSTP